MAIESTPRTEAHAAPSSRAYPDGPGYSWVLFASVLLMLLATINLIEGLTAASNSAFFLRDVHYVVGNLRALGWVLAVLGTIQFVVGVAVLLRNQFARWAGVALLAANAVAQLLFMPSYPLWSLSVIALDILGMFALVVHGERIAEP